jgi:cobalt-zinc-cadmium efflux system outer membrane protein
LSLLSLAAATASATEPVEALPAQLDLTAVLRLVRTRGLDLLIAESTVEASSGDVTAAGALANPELSFGVGRSFTYDPSRCAGCSDVAWSAGLSDQGAAADALFGRRRLRIAFAQALLAAAKQSRADVQRLGDFAAKQQYVAVAKAQQSLTVALEERRIWAELLELTRLRLLAGAISEADVVKAETAALSASQGVSTAGEELAIARANLAYLLGVRGRVSVFEVDGRVLAWPPSSALIATPASALFALAREARPDLRAALAQVAAAEVAVAAARRQRVPGLALSVQAAGQGRGQNAIAPPTLTVGVALTPPLLYQFQGEIRRAEASLRSQTLALTKAEAQVTSDIVAARAAYAATSERAVRARESLLPSATRARDIVRVQYEKGAASFLDLLDAQRTLLEVRRDAVAQAADNALAFFQLELAVGRELQR